MKQIVCLATSPWFPIPTRKQQVMSRIPDAEILYFDPSATVIAPLKDKTTKPLMTAYKKPGFRPQPNITVYSLPPVLPFFNRSRAINRINQKRIAAYVRMVFATAAPLAERLQAANPKARFIPNGADFERFNRASWPIAVPDEMRAIPHPIFGFVGALQPCIEYSFVECAAKAHPEWSFVWIGGEKPGANLSALKSLGNCHFLGIKPNDQLPQYLAQFDACLNLFAAGKLSKDVSPLKFYEYLATGKPIISTRQPDQILRYAPLIHIADTAEQFTARCAEALSDTQPERMEARIEEGRKSSWDSRVREMCAILRDMGIL